MKLRSLALNQFKKFTSPVRVEGIGDGLNVVVGPNEMGKSTLLDALRAALFEKHSSRAQPITALQNDRNQAAPVVELSFQMDDGLYRITKRFIKKPYARLTCPDGRILEGDAAEDALRNTLRFDEPGKTGAKPENLGMWNVLWVQQGQSFGVLDLPETARSSLHSALESEVGAVLGGRRGRALPQTIEKQLGELLTGNSKPRGAYKEAIGRRETLRAELAGLRARRQDLSQTLDDLEVAQTTLSRLSSGNRHQADQADLDSARTRHSELVALESRIQAARTELKLKERNVEQAEQVKEDRRKLIAAIAADEQAVTTASERLDEASRQEKEARDKYVSLQESVRAAESAVTKADASVALKRRILAAAERDARIRALQEQCKKAQDAEQRLHNAQQAAAAILVNDKAIQRIRTAAKAAESFSSRLTAAATTISFDMAADVLSGVRVDGAPLSGERPAVHAVERTTITIPDLGKITVDPAIRDRDTLVAQQRDASTKLTEALNAIIAASVEDAEDQYARRHKLLEQAEFAKQEAALHAPATDDYEAGAQPLAAHIEGLRQILAHEKNELDLRTLPTMPEAQEALRSAEELALSARHDLETIRAQLSGPEDSLHRLKIELITIETRYEDALARLTKRREELQNADAARSEQQRQADIDAARAALDGHQQAISRLEEQRTGETVPQLEARIERLEKAIRDRREKRETLNVKIAALTSRIEAFEGAGLDEAIEQKSRESELCDEEVKRFERETEVLGLLLSTLRAAEHDAKERYLSPVLKRLRPYLQLLFPGADIAIDENLRITGVVREAGYEESFHRLSMGTQEQIAILVRLAFAEVLMEQGHPATVILDDALVFSDDRRMGRMFDILNMAARNVQIVVLTCREQVFEGLGGRQLSLLPGSSEELISA